ELSSILKRGDLSGKSGQTLLLHNVTNIKAERVLLVGRGKGTLDARQLRKLAGSIAAVLNGLGGGNASLAIDDLALNGDAAAAVRLLVESFATGSYRFERFKSEKKPASSLSKLTL